MTDEAKALVERVETLPDTHALPRTLALLFDLRDCLETQAREIERLRAALRTKDNYDFDDLAIDIEAKFGGRDGTQD